MIYLIEGAKGQRTLKEGTVDISKNSYPIT